MDKKLTLIAVMLVIVGLLTVGAYGQVEKHISRSETTREICMPGEATTCKPDPIQ